MKEFTSFIKKMWYSFLNWWNEPISDEELEKLAEIHGANIPDELLYKNPIRRWYYRTKSKLDNTVGKGSFAVLLTCSTILAGMLIIGGSSLFTAAFISLATVYGAILAMDRFPALKNFITKHYKLIDLAAFVIGFYLANSVFGFQVAAITGLMISIALILWKFYSDKKIREGVKEGMENVYKAKDQIMTLVAQPAVA